MKCNSCIFRKIIKKGNRTQQICGYSGIQIDPVYSCKYWKLKPHNKTKSKMKKIHHYKYH